MHYIVSSTDIDELLTLFLLQTDALQQILQLHPKRLLFYPVWASGSEGCLNDVSLAVVSTLYLNISIEFISHLTLFTEVLGQRAIIHVCQSC